MNSFCCALFASSPLLVSMVTMSIVNRMIYIQAYHPAWSVITGTLAAFGDHRLTIPSTLIMTTRTYRFNQLSLH